MDKLERQEQDPRIRALRRLARRVTPPGRSEEGWERLERAVFERLDRAAPPGPLQRFAAWLMRPQLALPAVAFACLALAVVLGVRTSGTARVQVSLRVEGTAEVCRAPGNGAGERCAWAPLDSAAQVAQGCRIRTGARSTVAVVLDTGTGFVLGEDASVRLAEVCPRNQRYELDRGAIRAHLRRRDGHLQALVVVTPNAVCEAIGTVFTVTTASDSQTVTLLAVQSGAVRISARGVAERTRTVTAPGAVRLVGNTFTEEIALAPSESAQTVPDTAAAGVPDLPLRVPGSPAPAFPPLPLPDISVVQEPGLQSDMRLPDAAVLPEDEGVPELRVEPARQIDSAYLAGRIAGRDLYWRYDLVRLDTLGWAEALAPEIPQVAPAHKGPGASSAVAAAAGWRIVEAVQPAALSVALLRDLGYPVLFRTQWSAQVQADGSLDRRSYIEGERAFSDHLWERLERATVAKAARVKGGDFRVQLHFRNAGYAEFDGAAGLNLAQAPMAGIEGIALRQAGKRVVAGNVVRQFGQCCVLVPANKRLDEVAAEVERRMDALGCDMLYRAPQLREVR